MKIVGIIAEFNPMHTGHKYLVEESKKITNADIAICLMSGNFTQLGNVAIKDKFTRAKIAIENGFDAVIELPTIYATSSAEFFSSGAINILDKLNCIDYLCFGSESGNIKELTTISETLLKYNDIIWENITESLKEGISFAKAREYALSKVLDKKQLEIAFLSNNILAIQYIKTLLELNSKIIPIAIKREENDNITSATNIRNMVKNNLPYSETQKYILNPDKILDNPIINDKIYELLKYVIISNGKEYLKNINEVTEGLENKIYDEINNSNSYDEFIQNIKSKRYQLSKIKRIMLYILLNISKDDFSNFKDFNNIYAHIIAIKSNNKAKILSLLNSKSSIPIITSLSKLDVKGKIKKSIDLDIKASNIYSIISNNKINTDYTNKL